MENEVEFREALVEYLQSVQLVPDMEASSLIQKGEFDYVCFMKVDHQVSAEKVLYQLVIAKINKLKLLSTAESTFEGKIGLKLLERTIENVLCQFVEYPLPKEVVVTYVEEIFATILIHYQLSAEALVPLYNIRVEHNTEIILANSILCAGSSDSLYAQKLSHSEIEKRISVPKDQPFLRIPVSGDEESRARQVEGEVKKALSVLRFITMWRSKVEGAKSIKYNPAAVVNFREDGQRFILYYKPEEPERGPAYTSNSQRIFTFTKSDLDLAYQIYGLKELNYHFPNSDNHVSVRIIRALELYDSGITALSNRQSIYRYVASINVVLPMSSSNGKELAGYLKTLIQYGGKFVGTMKKSDGTEYSSGAGQTWEEMVQETAKPFVNFYRLRSKILHGNIPSQVISADDTEECRGLAYNAIRLMAFLAREFNWQSDEEAIKWFKLPEYPPSLNQET